jgi:hypothetical protein
MDAIETILELVEPPPPVVPVGTEIRIKAKVASRTLDDLAGGALWVTADGRVLQSGTLERGEDGWAGVELFVEVPGQVGTHAWLAVFPRQVIGGADFAESSVAVSFATRPQRTSLAVWDLPAPAVAGERFRLKVGAKSASGFQLGGTCVEVCDEDGRVAGSGLLGEAPWPGSAALHWADVDLTAPASEGIKTWTARFAAADVGLPHSGSSSTFTFPVTARAEHRLVARLVDRDGRLPIPDVEVRVGPHRGKTDDQGIAALAVPKGTHKLIVWKVQYLAPPTTIEVIEDLSLDIEMIALPTPPERDWM